MKKKTSGRSYAGVSAQQRLSERREKFLQAGLEIFGSQGFRAGTVRALCKQAGLTERYFYESFSDTEELLKAVYERHMSKLQIDLLQVAQQDQPSLAQRVNNALTVFFQAMRDPLVARISLTEILGVSSKIDRLYQANTQNFGALVMRYIQLEFPQIKIEPEQAATVGTALAGACAMSAAQWTIEGYATPMQKVVDACALIVLGTVKQLLDSADV